MRMTQAPDEMEVNFSITADSAPIIHRYMMASPPQLRRRRMTRLIPMACETVLRTLQLGGRMYSGGKLNPDEFASEGLDDSRWKTTPFILNLYRDVTPLLYSTLEGKSSDQVKVILTTCLESYLLTLGATTAPSDGIEVRPSPFADSSQVSMDTPSVGGPSPLQTDAGQEAEANLQEAAGEAVDQGADARVESPKDDSPSAPSSEPPSSTSSAKPHESTKDEAEDAGKAELDDESKRMLERMRGKGVAT